MDKRENEREREHDRRHHHHVPQDPAGKSVAAAQESDEFVTLAEAVSGFHLSRPETPSASRHQRSGGYGLGADSRAVQGPPPRQTLQPPRLRHSPTPPPGRQTRSSGTDQGSSKSTTQRRPPKTMRFDNSKLGPKASGGASQTSSVKGARIERPLKDRKRPVRRRGALDAQDMAAIKEYRSGARSQTPTINEEAMGSSRSTSRSSGKMIIESPKEMDES